MNEHPKQSLKILFSEMMSISHTRSLSRGQVKCMGFVTVD